MKHEVSWTREGLELTMHVLEFIKSFIILLITKVILDIIEKKFNYKN